MALHRAELARTAEDLPALGAMDVVRLVMLELVVRHVPHGQRLELGVARRAAAALLDSLGAEAELVRRNVKADISAPSNVIDMAAWRARRVA